MERLPNPREHLAGHGEGDSKGRPVPLNLGNARLRDDRAGLDEAELHGRREQGQRLERVLEH